MAEVVGAAASIIAIVQIADRIVSLVKLYIEASKDAPKDLRIILNEISTLKTTFENLKFLLDIDGNESALLQQLDSHDGPIEGCRQAISNLETLIGTLPVDLDPRQGKLSARRAFAHLAWPLKESKARKLLDEISRYKSTITLLLSNEAAVEIKQIRNEIGKLQKTATRAEFHTVLQWLVTVDPSSNHNRAFELHELHTGKWMLRSEDWQAWLRCSVRFLWIHGIPGSGKTVLASFLTGQLQTKYSGNSTSLCAVTYYYCHHSRNQDESTHFLRWTINQICRKLQDLPEALLTIYQDNSQPRTDQLLNVLAALADQIDHIYIVVDALDESRECGKMAAILTSLIKQDRFDNIQILVTSRDEWAIRSSFQDISCTISMTNDLVNEDIRTYIKSTLETDTKFCRWSPALLKDVEKALGNGACGMFRWASCQLELLRRANTEEAIRRCITELPKSLEEIYERVLLAIHPEEKLLAQHVFWLLCSPEGRLTAEMLLVAINESCSHEPNCVNPGFVDFGTLKEICSCLIRIDEHVQENEYGDFGHDVGLSHYTVLEYLESNRILAGPAADFHVSPHLAARPMTELALRHLYEHLDLPNVVDLKGNAHTFAFIVFCCGEGPDRIYFQQQLICSDPVLFDLVVRLMAPTNPNVDRVLKIFNEELWFILLSVKTISHDVDVLTLCNLVSAGLTTVAAHFLQSRSNITSIASTPVFIEKMFHGSLLEMCAFIRSAPLVECFLANGATAFDPQDILYKIVRLPAARVNQCSETVHAFISAGAQINPVGFPVTPLQAAVATMDEKFVSMLLNAGADPNGLGNAQDVDQPSSVEYKDFMANLNMESALANHMPLQICQENEYDEDAKARIEGLLLRYGARNIKK